MPYHFVCWYCGHKHTTPEEDAIQNFKCPESGKRLRTVEQGVLRGNYAYEKALFKKHGWHVRANRTWYMFEKYGIIRAAERLVEDGKDRSGYQELAKMKMKDMTFEAIVLRHPEFFGPRASALSTSNRRVVIDASAKRRKGEDASAKRR